jgi:DNA-binding IclR family transcriptional regulator
MISRDLACLAEAGYVERIAETGRWRIGAPLAQRSIATLSALRANVQKANELLNRYTTTP